MINFRSTLLLILSMLMALTLYQGCEDERVKNNGNGVPYTGLLPSDGLYYARIHNFTCPVGNSLTTTSGITRVIEVSDRGSSIQSTDACTGAEADLAVNELQVDSYFDNYLGFDSEIFQRFDSIPASDEPIPLSVCYVPISTNFLFQRHTVAFFPAFTNIQARTIVLDEHPTTGAPTLISLPLVTVTASDTFYPGGSTVPAFLYSAVDYNLTVSTETDANLGLNPGAFSGQLLNQNTQGDARCLAVRTLP